MAQQELTIEYGEYVHSDITWRIVGNHPHRDELCHPFGEDGATIDLHDIWGDKMYHVELVNCEHGVDSCFVKPSNIKET